MSFSGVLGTHVRDHHSDIATWSCLHCPTQLSSHNYLYKHMYRYHWEGQFACGIDDCKFDKVATTRSVIQIHLMSAHPSTIHTCDIDGCGKTFSKKCDLQAHQRIHLGLKPYRCKWTGCGYASAQRPIVLRHIRTKHLKLPKSLKLQQAQGIVDDRDPREFLHVDSELLATSK